MMRVWRLASVCLSRTSGLSREQRGLGRLKMAQRQITSHLTRTPLSRSKGQRSTCLMGKKGIACAHILLCCTLLWQCRHKLGKIAQCLFLRVVVIVCLLPNSFVNSTKLQSLTVFIFTADYIKTCRGRGHIVSPRALLVTAIFTARYGAQRCGCGCSVCRSA